MSVLQEEIRHDIRALGFDEVRFASAGTVPPGHRARFVRWLREGKQADMHWIERSVAKRLHPGLVLPGAQSLLLLGINYLPDDPVSLDQQTWAKFALYSDYHDTVKAGLVRVGRILEKKLGLGTSDYRYYVDTGPVLERGWAVRSGLGWQGKNGMLISRTHGNWLFLAAILLRYPLEPDEPLPVGGLPLAKGNRSEGFPPVGALCGTCRRCQDACPTDALAEPGLVDSRRCISYLTIENKGGILRPLRPLIGHRLFGCDICLDVCPWNRFARAGSGILLSARRDPALWDLTKLLAFSPDDFRRAFARSPVKRIKWRGLIRNACVVAGNALQRPTGPGEVDKLLPLLIGLASSEEPVVRAHAVWAVWRLAPDRAGFMLREARRRETDPVILAEYSGS